jgi:DNA helicase-2/ATP-dependent DNA helicase PcrA
MTFVVEDQHRKILDSTGHLLITGGPGSGKTSVALQKAKSYIDQERLLGAQNVLFLSFSRAAVARILEQLSSHTELQGYKRRLSIQTFHSFFWEILKTYGYLIGTPRRLRVLAPHDEDALRGGRPSEDASWLREREAVAHRHGKVCFDLFAPLTFKILSSSSKIRLQCTQKYPLIIVDEAQDTDVNQWKCLETFKINSQLVFLADLDQQIHDYRPDVTAERIRDIVQSLNPQQISLGDDNHRSSETEILSFARDVLNITPRNGSYRGVSQQVYHPRADRRDRHIRQSIGMLYSDFKKAYGSFPKSVAVLATWGRGVKLVSHALRGNESSEEIPHRVHFDETATYLSSRIIAFLLEPTQTRSTPEIAAEMLQLMIDLSRATNKVADAQKYERWRSDLIAGNEPTRSKVLPELQRIAGVVRSNKHTGHPERDWTRTRNILLNSVAGAVADIGRNAEFLMAFNRGKLISKGLSQSWQRYGEYRKARSILESAIVETQIVSEDKNQTGINVMTFHKAKGKEFDCVILFQNPHSSPFVLRNDKEPYKRSRKLLFVGITRARYRTVILKDASQSCPILGDFAL